MLEGSEIERRPVIQKHDDGIVVMLVGIATDSNAVHSKKAPSPKLITLEGIVTCERFVQPMKALKPISVTLLGMMIADNPSQ